MCFTLKARSHRFRLTAHWMNTSPSLTAEAWRTSARSNLSPGLQTKQTGTEVLVQLSFSSRVEAPKLLCTPKAQRWVEATPHFIFWTQEWVHSSVLSPGLGQSMCQVYPLAPLCMHLALWASRRPDAPTTLVEMTPPQAGGITHPEQWREVRFTNEWRALSGIRSAAWSTWAVFLLLQRNQLHAVGSSTGP